MWMTKLNFFLRCLFFQLNVPENRCPNQRSNWWLSCPLTLPNVPSRFPTWFTIPLSTSSRATAWASSLEKLLPVPSTKVRTVNLLHTISFSFLSLFLNLFLLRTTLNSTFIHKFFFIILFKTWIKIFKMNNHFLIKFSKLINSF